MRQLAQRPFRSPVDLYSALLLTADMPAASEKCFIPVPYQDFPLSQLHTMFDSQPAMQVTADCTGGSYKQCERIDL